MHWQNLKIFFCRTTGIVSTKLGTKHRLVKGIEICSNKEPFNSQKEDNGFFLLLINGIIYSYVFIDLNFFQVNDMAHGPLDILHFVLILVNSGGFFDICSCYVLLDYLYVLRCDSAWYWDWRYTESHLNREYVLHMIQITIKAFSKTNFKRFISWSEVASKPMAKRSK